MNQNKVQELLEKLGLTEYESKTLTSLFSLREAKAPDISMQAQVPKTRVYDVLTKLVEKDLIIEIQGRPKKYRVVEPEKVFSKLVENRKTELTTLEKETKNTQKLMVNPELSQDEEEKVMKVKDRQDFVKVLIQELKEANHSIYGFSETIMKHNALKRALQDAKKNNIDVKMLIHSGMEYEKELEMLGIPKKTHQHGMEAYIIDNKKLVLALSDLKKDKTEYHFTIWQNQPVINVFKSHFDNAWATQAK